MNHDDLDALCRRFIACLNERRIDDAEVFYCDALSYNGRRSDAWNGGAQQLRQA